jgi:hypothetical protein
MIMLLILKLFGLVEYALEYLVTANMSVTKSTTDGQWTLAGVYVAPTTKGWAILTDIMTLLHNTLDMLAQFSLLFPINGSNAGYVTTTAGFGSSLRYTP